MLICVYNNKGGVGKTTLATSIAFRAIEKNIPLVFIDKDPQRNGMKWLSNDEWSGEEHYVKGSIEVSTNFSYIDTEKINVIDAPPSFDFALQIEKVDMWIVPVQGRFSLDGAMNLITQLKEVGRSDERMAFVSNGTDVDSDIGKIQVNEAQRIGVEVFKYAISRSNNFSKAEFMCIPVWTVPYAQRAGAVQSLMLFTDWVLKRCPEKGTYGDSINYARTRKYAIENLEV